MALGTDYAFQDCSLARTLEVVGERWTMLIIRDAFYGVHRFNDFLVHLEIPRAVLTTRLQALVAAGVLTKQPYLRSPVRYSYVLTQAGRELWQPIYGLAQWGERNASNGKVRTIFSHFTCSTRLDRAGNCPACGGPVPPEDITIRPGPGADASLRKDPVSRALARPHRLLTPLQLTDGTAG
ncbi:winged helix-turn-helix transcriptional regulator [Microbispora rosea]|uniref:Transcriptional regulator, HxlR family n=1 Tax=Microbispora rosea TaxID=58117 RepID=A0A1N7HAY8_9ACTN|nr:helix-turn-helix domain-containing protein [Microbispora rosea]GIH52451.1 ArsR family transcriptional regulator [Microbispora rosea subsp. rosea]SIS22026.1 transcriptional regulator, HxlR family [Microbispora rosea]